MAELLLDFLNSEDPPIEHVIGRGVLPVAGKCIIGGPPKSNKSFVAINIALDLALGRPIFNARYKNGNAVLPTYKPNKVLILEQELDKMGLKGRLRSIIAAQQINPTGLDFYVKTKDIAMLIDSPQGQDEIASHIAQVMPDVLFLDPLAKFHGKDENSAQEMGDVMRVVDKWVQAFNCAVVIIHHTALASLNPEMGRRGGQKLRGSSAIFADTDTVIDVTRKSSASTLEPLLQLELEMRRGEPMEHLFVKRLASGVIRYEAGREPAPSTGGAVYEPRGNPYAKY